MELSGFISSALSAVNPAALCYKGQQRLEEGRTDQSVWLELLLGPPHCCRALFVLLGCSNCELIVVGARVWEDVFRYEVPAGALDLLPLLDPVTVVTALVVLGPEVQIR